jgi:hypothetical protein
MTDYPFAEYADDPTSATPTNQFPSGWKLAGYQVGIGPIELPTGNKSLAIYSFSTFLVKCWLKP